MESTTRLSENDLKEILSKHFETRGVKLMTLSIGRETYGGDPRETPYSYVDVKFEMVLK